MRTLPTNRRRLERRSAEAAGGAVAVAADRRVLSCRFALKAVDDAGAVEGYGSVFGVKDSYGDIVAPGAFAESLAAHRAAGTMPAMLWQHRADMPCGVWDVVREDDRGLYMAGRLADTDKGREARALLKLGALDGLSIGFMSKEWLYDRETETRTLTAIDLWEVSLVTFPANGAARVVGVKAAELSAVRTIRQAERALRDAGLSDDAAKALVAAVKRAVEDERDARQAVAEAQRAAERLLARLNP